MRYGDYEYSDLPDSYKSQANCSICENLRLSDTSKDFYGKELCYCKEKCKYVKKDGEICRDVLISSSNYSRLGSYSPSGCYITTIACEILGYDDNCELLNTLRDFRENYLKKNLDKYLPILQQYDFIGPMISNGIRSMENNKRFALMIMSYYLLPCAQEIKNNNYEKAIEIYKDMVLLLTSTFGISLTIGENIPYNFEDLGKGRVRINKKTQVTA